MFSAKTALALLPFLTTIRALPTQSPAPQCPAGTSTVLYFLENQDAGTQIVSLAVPVSGDMVVDYAKTFADGHGQRGMSGGKKAGPDSLFGQGSVCVSQSDDLLFSVNPGSDTVSMFAIDKSNPLSLKMIGTPAATLGDFPMSVTYSEELKMACVLNGGKVAGVTCFSVNPSTGMTSMDKTTRALPTSFNQTTPPNGPGGTASQVSFSPNNDFLVATIKSDGKTGGPIMVWPVVNGKVSMTPTTGAFSNLALPFGFDFLGNDNTMLISGPGTGAAIVSVNSDMSVHEVSVLSSISNFSAPCWATTTPDMSMGFVIDAGTTQIGVVEASTGSVTKVIQSPAQAKGGFDSVTDGKKLYVLASTAHIAVLDIVGDDMPMLLDFQALGQRPSWEGLAMYSM